MTSLGGQSILYNARDLKGGPVLPTRGRRGLDNLTKQCRWPRISHGWQRVPLPYLKCHRSVLLLYPFSFLAFLVLWPGWGQGDSPSLDVHTQSLIVEVEESLVWLQLDLK